MIFDDESKIKTFPLTPINRNFWRGRKFLTKKELMYAIDNWKIFPLGEICITNVICDKWGPELVQSLWLDEQDTENIISSLAEISLSHGIIYIGYGPGAVYNRIGVAETSNHQTNIDADVIDAIVKKIGGCCRK